MAVVNIAPTRHVRAADRTLGAVVREGLMPARLRPAPRTHPIPSRVRP